MKVKCAIFDFDGTLFDSMSIWDNVGEIYLQSLGKEPNPSMREDVKAMSLYQAACYLQREYSLSLSADEIMAGINHTIEHFYIHEVLPKPGVADFLERMKRSEVSMCIATASDRYQIEAALSRCGMGHYFDAVRSGMARMSLSFSVRQWNILVVIAVQPLFLKMLSTLFKLLRKMALRSLRYLIAARNGKPKSVSCQIAIL